MAIPGTMDWVQNSQTLGFTLKAKMNCLQRGSRNVQVNLAELRAFWRVGSGQLKVKYFGTVSKVTKHVQREYI